MLTEATRIVTPFGVKKLYYQEIVMVIPCILEVLRKCKQILGSKKKSPTYYNGLPLAQLRTYYILNSSNIFDL